MLALLALLLLGAVSPPPAGVATLARDAEARWIAFELTPGNQIRFAMQLDGRAVSAVLDTGVSYSVLSKDHAALNPAAVRPGGNAAAIGGTVAIGWTPTDTLALGGLTRRGGGIAVTALPAAATGGAKAVDLLVGRDLIGGHALDIDYAARRLRVIASGRLPFGGRSAPLTISGARLVFEGEMTLGGARLSPMVVDTGDGAAVTLSAPAWRRAGIAGVPTTTGVAFGLAGPVVSELAVVDELRVGQLTARNVEVRVEPAGGFSETIGIAGRIGSGFLRNYRVLLDPGARRMVLSPGAKADAPPVRSTSGLLVGVARDRLRVLHVMRDGPAAGTWREGDQICAIDGTPVTAAYPGSALAGWSIGVPGRVVALSLCDGSERQLTLNRFY